MRELALNILDIAENSVKAGASLVRVLVEAKDGRLTIEISDNGCGMDAEFVKRVTDPFTTTRTTRKVGMGIPLFKMAAEMADGTFSITSEKGVGTTVTATFVLDHIDRAPPRRPCGHRGDADRRRVQVGLRVRRESERQRIRI